MSSTRAGLLPRLNRFRPQFLAVGLVLLIVALAIVVGAAMDRPEPMAPEFPRYPGMEQVASGSMSIPMLGLDYENARSTVFTVPGAVPDVYSFYTQDVTQEGWTVVSSIEDVEGSAVVYLVRYDSVAMVQIMDAAVARDRQVAQNPRLDVNPTDLEGAGTIVIVGSFKCTDESGTAVCLDYIIQGQ